MFKEPMLREFFRICKNVDCSGADVMDCSIDLFDLIIGKGVTVLFRMNFGMVQNFIAEW